MCPKNGLSSAALASERGPWGACLVMYVRSRPSENSLIEIPMVEKVWLGHSSIHLACARDLDEAHNLACGIKKKFHTTMPKRYGYKSRSDIRQLKQHSSSKSYSRHDT